MSRFDKTRLARIGDFVQAKYLDTGKLPHAALMIGGADGPEHVWASGVAEDAVFRIASMTKPITSVALMQLVERGEVALSHPVAKYVPEFANLGVFAQGGGAQPFVTRPPATRMNVVDLMRHTSGLTYSFQERTPVDAAYRRTELEHWDKNTSQSFIDHLAKIPLEFDPGTAWNYSVSTDVLGVIVERVSGLSLGDYFAEHIFKPLGMGDTGFQVSAGKAARLPDCYAYDPSAKMKLVDKAGADSGWAKGFAFQSGGGGLTSTLADYEKFCRAMLNGGSGVIARKTLDLMTANHLPGGGDLTQHSISLFSEAENAGIGFGLGFAVNGDPAATLIPGSKGEYYWGGMYSTAFMIDPVEQLSFVFMTQLMPSSTYPVRRELRTLIYSALR